MLGRVSVTLADVMRGAGFPDTLSYAFSTYDPHGWSFHPTGRLGLLPARMRRCPCAPCCRGMWTNLLVYGKALPMEQDALHYARMAPDVMVTGYLAGRVADAGGGAAERCETAG